MKHKLPDLNRPLFRTGARINRRELLKALQPAGDGAVVENHAAHYQYYDTFDWRLYFGDLTLVSIESGRQQNLVVFRKGKSEPVATSPGPIGSGFVRDLDPERLPAAVKRLVGIRRLIPRLSVFTDCNQVRIVNNDQKTVLRLTLETLCAEKPGRNGEPYAGQRILFHPLKGYENYQQKAAKNLIALFPECLDEFETFLHCLKTVGDRAGDYSSGINIELEPNMPAGQAARQIHLYLLEMMKRNTPGILGDIDTEYLHDFRVATRRTRSALSLVDNEVLPADVVSKAKQDFQLIGQMTSRFRDLDVYLLALPGYKNLIPAEYRENLDAFGQFLRQQRQSEKRNLEGFLAGGRYHDIITGWHDYLAGTEAGAGDGESALTPVKSMASHCIWKAWTRLMKKAKAIDSQSPKERYHEVRILAKKLRYLMEFMSSLYPRSEMKAAIKNLKKLQNVLGEFQDAVVQSAAIRRYGCEMSAAGIGDAETLMAMGMVAETIVAREQIALESFKATFDQFSNKATRTHFINLFSKDSLP